MITRSELNGMGELQSSARPKALDPISARRPREDFSSRSRAVSEPSTLSFGRVRTVETDAVCFTLP
jgi:hypothetical protein